MIDEAAVDALFGTLDGSVERTDALLAHVKGCVEEEICPICLGPVIRHTVPFWPGEQGMECVLCNRVYPAWVPEGSSAQASPEIRTGVSSYWRLTWTEIREEAQL